MMEAYRQYSEMSARKLCKSNTYQEFINKCKTDPEFSEKWGLKIEERELSLEERYVLYFERLDPTMVPLDIKVPNIHQYFTELNIPTKLITLTYKNETIESYE